MNDNLFHSELAAILAAAPYAEFAALMVPAGQAVPQILAGQAAAYLTNPRPLLTISGAYTPYETRRVGDLTLELRSQHGDDVNNAQHQPRTMALITALLGVVGTNDAASQANRLAAFNTLAAAFATRAVIQLISYGPARNFLEGTVEGDDLKTTLTLRAAFKFLPA